MRIEEGLEKRISTDKILDYIEWCEENNKDATKDNLKYFLISMLSREKLEICKEI